MEENKKSASPKKNCRYGSLDSIVCIKGGGMGVAVGIQEGKFCITIQKLYCFVSLFQKNILILLLHVCGKRLKRQGSDCTAGGRMRRNFSDYFRCIRLITNDLPTNKYYYCEE